MRGGAEFYLQTEGLTEEEQEIWNIQVLLTTRYLEAEVYLHCCLKEKQNFYED